MAEEEIISTTETDEQDRERHDPPADPSGEIERREPEEPGTTPIEEPPDMTDEEQIPTEEPPVEEERPGAKVAVAASSEEPEAEAAGAPASEDGKNWYIIHTYSGFEQKVADSLKGRAQAFGFADQIGQILIPTEEVMELRAGKKVTSKRLLYPGYVLVQMAMSDQLWHEVKNTPRVTGFVGGGNSPVPLSAEEVNNILYRQQTSAKTPRPKMTFEKNETVKIVDGPFANFSGKIDEINSDRNTLRVLVTIFGRATPVELDFLQVEKI
jgi:transcription termination/antitermination protein NusG